MFLVGWVRVVLVVLVTTDLYDGSPDSWSGESQTVVVVTFWEGKVFTPVVCGRTQGVPGFLTGRVTGTEVVST